MRKVNYIYGDNEKYNYYLLDKNISKSKLAQDFTNEPNGYIVNDNGIESNYEIVLMVKDKSDNYKTFISINSEDDFEILGEQ